MATPGARSLFIVALAVCAALAGCNDILDIDPPSDQVLVQDAGAANKNFADAAASGSSALDDADAGSGSDAGSDSDAGR